jgi:hypothetical protein
MQVKLSRGFEMVVGLEKGDVTLFRNGCGTGER